MRPPFDLATYFAGQIYQAEEEASRVYEPMIGIVTDNKDPDKLGRVKVKFPVLSEQDTSWWAPIIMMGAGKNRGWFFIPEKDDEVLCMFEHGDISRPLIVGALWNGKDKAPDKNPGGNPRRVIKSRAGSKLTLDDEEMKIILEDGSGKGKITFDSNGNKIQIEALVGDVAFMTPKDETKIVAQAIEIKATSNIEVHSGKAMQWGANNVTINGSGGVTMSGSKVNLNCGNAQSPTAPTAEPQDIADPYEARGSSQQAQQGQQQPQQSPPPPTSTSTTASTPSPSSQEEEQDEAEDQQSEQQEQQEQKKDDPDVHVVSLELKTPGGQPLGFESVILVKKGTDEKVAGPETADEKGHVSFVVDEAGEYEYKIVEDSLDHPSGHIDEKLVNFDLHCQVFDDGVPVAGETVSVRGPGGTSQTVVLNDAGVFELPAEQGEYEVKVRNQTFKVQAVRASDFGGAHELHIEDDLDKKADFEKARAHRYSPANRGEHS